MTDTITAIKKALEGVTPGPWGYVASNENHGPYVCNDWGAGDICDGYVMSKPDSLSIRNGGDSKPINHQHDEADANMRYIAAINPEAISELLSTLESLQRENEELKAWQHGALSCREAEESRIDDYKRELEEALCAQDIATREQTAAFSVAQARAEEAEAEVKRLRMALSEIATDEEYRILSAEEAQTVARAALSSTGDTHGN